MNGDIVFEKSFCNVMWNLGVDKMCLVVLELKPARINGCVAGLKGKGGKPLYVQVLDSMYQFTTYVYRIFTQGVTWYVFWFRF